MSRRWSALAALALCSLFALASPRTVSAATRAPARPAATTDADGTWREHGALPDQFMAVWSDSVNDRLVVLGDWDPGLRELPLAGPPVWHSYAPWPMNVYPNDGTTAWDETTGEAFVLADDGNTPTVWRVATVGTPAVTPITTSGIAPGPRGAVTMRYDRAGQRLFVWGGYPTFPNNAVNPGDSLFVLQLGPSPAWSVIMPTGLPWFAGGLAGDLFVDESRGRLLAIGTSSDSVWVAPLAAPGTWNELPTSSAFGGPRPASRRGNVVYDRAHDTLWELDPANTVWSLSLATLTWTALPAAGSPPPVLVSLGYPSLAMDRVRHRLIVEGGRNARFSPTAGLWALTPDGSPTWTQMRADPPRPDARNQGALWGYDPVRHRVLVAGGELSPFSGYSYDTDTWALDDGPEPAWSQVTTVGSPPATNAGYVSAWDPVRDAWVLFGSGGDIVTLSFAGATPAWGTLGAGGTPPPLYSIGAAVYDPVRDRFVVLSRATSATETEMRCWELALSPAPVWRALAPAGPAPSARFQLMAERDAAHDRLVMFGGFSYVDAFSPNAWTLDFSSGDGVWTRLATLGPAGRESGLLAYEPLRQRMVLAGGLVWPQPTTPAYAGDTWALDLTGTPTWHPLATDGDVLVPRWSAVGGYDPARDRILMSGGLQSGLCDAWTLTFAGDVTATDIALATEDVGTDHVTLAWDGAAPGAQASLERQRDGGAWQPYATLSADGSGRFGFTDHAVAPGDRLGYRLALAANGAERHVGAVTVVVPAAALALRANATGAHGVRLSVQLPGAGTARLALYDLAGRRVWNGDLAATGGGAQEVTVDGAALEPGLYFARLAWGRESRSARVALIR